MKTKFFSSVLLLAMVITTVGMFVSCKDYDDDITDLRSKLTSNATDLESLVNEKINNVEAEISSFQTQATALESAYQAADASLQSTLESSIANAKSGAVSEAEAYADIQAAQAQSASIAAAQDLVNNAISSLQSSLDAANQTIADQGTTINGLIDADATLTQGMQDAQARADEAYTLAQNAYDLALSSSSEAVDSLKEKVDNLYTLSETLEGVIITLSTTASEAYAQATTNATAIEGLQGQLQDLLDSNDNIAAALESAGLSAESITSLLTDVNNNSESIKTQQSDIEKLQSDAEENLATAKSYTDEAAQAAADNLKDAVDGINTSIEDLTTAYEAADKALQDQIDALTSDIEDLKSQISGVDLTKINTYLVNANKRLKSLVFAPTTYVDGIEAIMFATLQYEDWGDALEADAPATGNSYIIDDANHVEEYLVNPKNINLNDIESFSFISNSATNTFTKAVSQDAPIAVVEGSQKLNDGVLSLNLIKTGTESFGTDGEKFTIVALKAVLKESVLTDEEKAEGDEVAIYSDWARLYETSVTPYIHNALEVDANDKLVEGATDSHFYTYSELYDGGTKADELAESNSGEYVVKEIKYDTEYDLDSLVMVCDEDGNSYDLSQYGLVFEFNIMPYLLQNSATGTIDQAQYAKIADDGHTIYSTGTNGTKGVRSAIGKQPAIQVILKDTVNNKVVDVKYLKIQWTAGDDNTDYIIPLDTFEDIYTCSGESNDTVAVDILTALYNDYDMTETEFIASYTLCTDLFASKEDAATDDSDADASLGTLEYITVDGSKTIQWSGAEFGEITEEDYNNGSKEIDAWGYFKNENTNERIVFEVTLTLSIEQMSIVNKDQTMWNNGARNVNPELESDTSYGNGVYSTTMILGDLVAGYTGNPSSIDDIVVDESGNFNGASFVFDEDKLSEVASATGTDVADWSISDEGLTLSYLNVKEGEDTIAATINSDGIIQLYESDNGSSTSEPSIGAKLLVGNSVPVKLVASYCDLDETLDSYNVNFLTPLTWATDPIEATVYDITSGGYTSEPFASSIRITELFNTNKRIVYTNYSGETAVSGLADWYGLGDVTFDTDNAMTNIQEDGSIGTTCNTLLSDVKYQNEQKYSVSVNSSDWTVTFYNMKGNAVGQEFQIEIPVTISTKWQDNIGTTLVVTVKPSL